MSKYLSAIAVIFLMCTTSALQAQTACASLVVVPSSQPVIPCDTSKVIDISFNATIGLNFAVNETNAYTVDTIPYAPLPWVGANTVLNGFDDQWSNVVKLPFPFCFYGNTYEYYVIGANGRISFDTTLQGTYDNFATNTGTLMAPDPDPNFDMNNTIMAAYQDLDPSVAGSITWDTFGVAPCRTMVINWTSVPLYSCNNLIDSQQIVLYELSNQIDINLANKPVCATFNGGLALQGIQNSTGTQAVVPPGRNNTVWSANNDSRRFTPSGNPYVFTTTYTWRNGITNSIIDTGSNITLSAPFPPSVVCEAAIYGGCNTDTTFAVDTTVFIQGVVEAKYDILEDSLCLGSDLVLTNISTVGPSPLPAPQLLINTWDMGDGNVFVNNAGTFVYTYQQPGTYLVKLHIIDSLGCQDSITKMVFVEDSTFVSLTASPLSVCLGDFVQFDDQKAPHTVTTVYDFGDGTILSDITKPRHTYQTAGTYLASYTGFYLVCPMESESVTISVNDIPRVDLGPDQSYCPGLSDAITLRDVLNPTQIMSWSDGTNGPSLETKVAGRYWATAANGNCITTDSIWIKRDCYLNIPNTFSPNADGFNDYFMPRQMLSSGLKEFNMKIMNRWGKIIYETNRVDGRGWDGKYGGKDQPVGVFVYLIEAKWDNNYSNSFRGNVTLLR